VALGAALERRRLTGRGGVARAALAGCGAMIQAQFMYDFDGRAPFDEPAGRQARGWGPFYHCYRAADGWLFFAAPTERAAALARVPELADLAGQAEEGLAAALADRFAHPSHRALAGALCTGSAAVVPLGRSRPIAMPPCTLKATALPTSATPPFAAIRHDRHPMGRWVDLVAPNAVRPDRATITIPGHAPKPGAQTRAILSRIGLTEAEIGHDRHRHRRNRLVRQIPAGVTP
jgi:crotonobetainyl-CoA:carnitine CoA-transferase CaiB-like acyl-CoA transferase